MPETKRKASTDHEVRTRLYHHGVVLEEGFGLDGVAERLAQAGQVVWVDLCAPDGDDLATIADELGLHTLAVEDATSVRQRPKLDRYSSHAFLNTYTLKLDVDTGELATSEVAAFITPNAFITIRKDASFDMDAVVARWDAAGDLAKYGVEFLLHGLLDFVVDSHFETVESLDGEIEALEDMLFSSQPAGLEVQRRSFQLRRSLVLMRRIVLPMREVVNALMRRESDAVHADMYPYFQDVYDHVLRATEWTESLRDLVTTILETTLTIQSNRMNVITKKVTSWAAIIAVPTFVTGFYGMNVPYPGFSDHGGLIASVAVILIAPVVLWTVFKRKDWL